jgi:hypothetical protein
MTTAIERLLDLPPFEANADVKQPAFLAAVRESLLHHFENCPPYRRWALRQGFDPRAVITDLATVPFLPVNIFKRLLLRSVPEEQVVRTLASSATSSQIPSRIPLDQITRSRQMKALAAILGSRLGNDRRPFVILDAPPNISLGQGAASAERDQELSAREAGMRGYMLAASEKHYALQRDGNRLILDVDRLRAIIAPWISAGKRFSMIGYTFVLYEHVVRLLIESGQCLDLPESTTLIHFGGWKKLQQQAVTKTVLNEQTAAALGFPVSSICDIYGFTEQLGVVYPDDAAGMKRVPTYAEVLVREPRTLEPVPDGTTGLLEFICPLPHSYPGTAILLDDMGRILSRDGGTAFEIVGRAKRAEVRGCGDTLPQHVYEGQHR